MSDTSTDPGVEYRFTADANGLFSVIDQVEARMRAVTAGVRTAAGDWQAVFAPGAAAIAALGTSAGLAQTEVGRLGQEAADLGESMRAAMGARVTAAFGEMTTASVQWGAAFEAAGGKTMSTAAQVADALKRISEEAGRAGGALGDIPPIPVPTPAPSPGNIPGTNIPAPSDAPARAPSQGAQDFFRQNMQYQLGDLMTSALSGMPLGMALMQQGGQIAGSFAPDTKLADAGKSILDALSGMATPLNMAIVGMSLAATSAGALYDLVTTGGVKVEDELQKHVDLVSQIDKAYENAGNSARQYETDSIEVMERLDERSKEKVREGSIKAIDSFADKVSPNLKGTPDALASIPNGEKYMVDVSAGEAIEQQVRDAFDKWSSSGKLASDASELRARLSEIGSQAGGDMRKSLLDALEDPEVKNAFLALGATEEEYFRGRITGMERATQQTDLDIRSIEARTVAQRVALAVDQTYLDLTGKKVSEDAARVQAEAAGLKIITQAERDAADARRTSEDARDLAGMEGYARSLAEINQKYEDQIEDAKGAADAIKDLKAARDADTEALDRATRLQSEGALRSATSARDMAGLDGYDRRLAEIRADAAEQRRLAAGNDDAVKNATVVEQLRIDALNISTAKDNNKSLRTAEFQAATAVMLPYTKALAEINQRYEEGVRLAGANRDAVATLTRIREAEITALDRQTFAGPMLDATREISEQIRALEAQEAALGRSAYETERAAKAQDLANGYMAQGVQVTPELQKEIDSLADTYARVSVASQNMSRLSDSIGKMPAEQIKLLGEYQAFLSDELARGRITAEQFSAAYRDATDSVDLGWIDRASAAFDAFGYDAVTNFSDIGDAARSLVQDLGKIAWDETVSRPLRETFRNALTGGAYGRAAADAGKVPGLPDLATRGSTPVSPLFVSVVSGAGGFGGLGAGAGSGDLPGLPAGEDWKKTLLAFQTAGNPGYEVEKLNPDMGRQLAAALGNLHARGINLTVNDGFRTYEDQAQRRAQYGANAARPGFSAHESGNAVDLSIKQLSADQRATAVDVLRQYGLVNNLPGEAEAQHFVLRPGFAGQSAIASAMGGGNGIDAAVYGQQVAQAAADFTPQFKGALDGVAVGTGQIGQGFVGQFGGVLSAVLNGMGGGSSGANLGGIASAAMSLFGGFFAEGGSAPAGKWIIAGERGPEPIWTGSSGAHVVSNRDFGGGGDRGQMNVSVNLKGANGDAAIEAAVRRGVVQSIGAVRQLMPGWQRDADSYGTW